MRVSALYSCELLELNANLFTHLIDQCRAERAHTLTRTQRGMRVTCRVCVCASVRCVCVCIDITFAATGQPVGRRMWAWSIYCCYVSIDSCAPLPCHSLSLSLPLFPLPCELDSIAASRGSSLCYSLTHTLTQLVS